MRRLAFAALVAVAACSRAPSSPSSPASTPAPGFAGLSGAWTGTFHLTDCKGDRHCTTYMFLGSPFSFTLKVQQTGARVLGSFSGGGFTADVSGDVIMDGWVTLTGATPPSAEKGSMQVTAVKVRATEAHGLEGSIAYATWPSLSESAFELPSSYGGPIVKVTWIAASTSGS